LKRFLDRCGGFVQHYRIDDNPYLDAGFVEALKREYRGTMYYGRYIEGLWTAADGLVYPRFGNENVERQLKERYERYVVSVDYGTRNATAMLLFGCADGVWTAVDEFYGGGLTDEEYYAALHGLAERRGARVDCVIVDPSAASFITTIRRKGEFAVKRADNGILDGIRNTASALSKGLLRIHENCGHLLDEIARYRWCRDGGEERPEKKDDHACDALRYFVRTMRISI
jgi:PBSX family phage terminase large subunit